MAWFGDYTTNMVNMAMADEAPLTELYRDRALNRAEREGQLRG